MLIAAGIDVEHWDKDRWTIICHEFLRHTLKTPRQAVRLSNTLSVTFPAVAGEINPVDYIGIEALRVSFPSIYDAIRTHPEKFSGIRHGLEQNRDREWQFYDALLFGIDEPSREPVTRLLKLLFPRLDSIFGNMHYDTERMTEWRNASRVCSDRHFSLYFQYAVPLGHVTNSELGVARQKAKEQSKFEEIVLSYASQIDEGGSSRLPEFLDRFLDILKNGNFEPSDLENVIKALLAVGDHVDRPEDEPRGMWGIVDTPLRMLWVISTALERIPRNARFPLLQEALSGSDSLNLCVRVVVSLGYDHGKYTSEKSGYLVAEEQCKISRSEFDQCEALLREKINQAADQGTLLQHQHLGQILSYWYFLNEDGIGGRDEACQWAKCVTKDDTGLKTFLIGLSGKAKSSSGDGIVREQIFVRPSEVDRYIDIDHTYERVNALLSGNLLDGSAVEPLNAFKLAVEAVRRGESEDRWWRG